MRLLAALFLIRKLPLLTVLFISLALLLPLFSLLSSLANWIAPQHPQQHQIRHSGAEGRAPISKTEEAQ